MNENTKAFLKAAYREYYFGKGASVELPEDMGSREFGYIPFGGGMVRHLSFRSAGEAIAEFVRLSPSSVYCSNATYSFPSAPIDEKGWLGAELIFDIDATDIPTPCKKGHDLWFCTKCHISAKLPRPGACPKCGSETEEFHGTCAVCLAAAKEHSARLLELLFQDFGVPYEEVAIHFSGNRGYHLYINDGRFRDLDQAGRAEIAGYVRGESLPSNQALAASLRRSVQASGAGGGWGGRITRYASARRQGYSGTMVRLVSEAIAKNRALVDASVTTDIHRVFRLAGTLHGKTGMAKCRVDELDTFDPEKSPIVLANRPVKISTAYHPRFFIGGESYGPFKSQTVELPTYAAVSVLTSGLGEVA